MTHDMLRPEWVTFKPCDKNPIREEKAGTYPVMMISG